MADLGGGGGGVGGGGGGGGGGGLGGSKPPLSSGIFDSYCRLALLQYAHERKLKHKKSRSAPGDYCYLLMMPRFSQNYLSGRPWNYSVS